jgi:hypothetical protein
MYIVINDQPKLGELKKQFPDLYASGRRAIGAGARARRIAPGAMYACRTGFGIRMAAR